MSQITRRAFCTGAVATVMTPQGDLFAKRTKTSPGNTNRAKPFVKWAGGKGQLLEQLDALFPRALHEGKLKTYVEPFVGGGAMLFYLLAHYPAIERVIINDINANLTGVYRVVKECPQELIAVLRSIQTEFFALEETEARAAYYLAKRAQYNTQSSESVEQAALFIFLNRTGFNGLYRVNARGEYNVPFGKAKRPQICDEQTLLADSRLLQKVEILTGDFAGVAERMSEPAFVYLDPPYRPLPKTPSFTAYAKDGFNDDQQRRLATFCRTLDAQGHRWLLSNSDPANTDPADHFFDELYQGFEIHRVYASRMINAKADGRGKIAELAIRNYQE